MVVWNEFVGQGARTAQQRSREYTVHKRWSVVLSRSVYFTVRYRTSSAMAGFLLAYIWMYLQNLAWAPIVSA